MLVGMEGARRHPLNLLGYFSLTAVSDFSTPPRGRCAHSQLRLPPTEIHLIRAMSALPDGVCSARSRLRASAGIHTSTPLGACRLRVVAA
jgi:hypothetical protein